MCGLPTRGSFCLMALVLAGCMPDAARSPAAEVQRLLELHQAGLQAHLDGDIDALLAHQAEDFVLVDRGDISSPSMGQRREFLGPYLAATRFEFYRDTTPPIVKISRDGSLGWVIARVEARGAGRNPDGSQTPLEFMAAWIELYERRGDSWISIGNASNFKPAASEAGAQ